EISPSGTGVHILVRGHLPPGGRKRDWVEIYSEARYFTVTGRYVVGTPSVIHERTAELATLHRQIFETDDRRTPPPPPSSASRSTSLSDIDLVLKASAAANGHRFSALWKGDLSEYNNDDSAADLALCNLLAFWSGCDAEQMDRVFRQSK